MLQPTLISPSTPLLHLHTSFLQSTSPSLLRRKKMQPTSEQPSLNNVQFDPVKLYRGVSGWWYKKQNLEGLLYLKRKGVPKKHEDDVRRHEQKIKRRYMQIQVSVPPQDLPFSSPVLTSLTGSYSSMWLFFSSPCQYTALPPTGGT